VRWFSACRLQLGDVVEVLLGPGAQGGEWGHQCLADRSERVLDVRRHRRVHGPVEAEELGATIKQFTRLTDPQDATDRSRLMKVSLDGVGSGAAEDFEHGGWRFKSCAPDGTLKLGELMAANTHRRTQVAVDRRSAGLTRLAG
jgi:hypothetical protein